MLLRIKLLTLRKLIMPVALIILPVLVISFVSITLTKDKSATRAERFEHTPD